MARPRRWKWCIVTSTRRRVSGNHEYTVQCSCGADVYGTAADITASTHSSCPPTQKEAMSYYERLGRNDSDEGGPAPDLQLTQRKCRKCSKQLYENRYFTCEECAPSDRLCSDSYTAEDWGVELPGSFFGPTSVSYSEMELLYGAH